MDLKQIEQMAFREMGRRKEHESREPGWLYFHGMRTARIAAKLADSLGVSVLRDIMHAGALLHDIGKGGSDHAGNGAAILKKLLKPLCTKSERRMICEIVRSHNRRRTEEEFPVEILLVQDADLIDHVGIIAPWLTFYWAGVHNESIDDHISWVSGAENARYRKNMRRGLNFPESMRLFDERTKWEDMFFENFREGYLGRDLRDPATSL